LAALRALMSLCLVALDLRELLEELGVSQYRLAQDIGVPTLRISHVVRGRRPVTAELALRLGRYLGQSPRY
jgi:addiction module HigA family antidote